MVDIVSDPALLGYNQASFVTTVPSTTGSQTNPDYETLTYQRMAIRRHLPRTLMQGTPGMRINPQYLPKHPAEEDKQYKIRQKNAVLRNFFSRTLGTLVGKVFSQPIITKDVNPKLKDTVVDNIDLNGRNLHSFAYDVFNNAIADGVSYILVDYPTTPKDLSLAAERELKLRPYALSVQAGQVIGWVTEKIDGVDVLVEVRIKEALVRKSNNVTSAGPSYSEQTYLRIRILRLGSFEIWESGVDNTWEKTDSGPMTVPFIPLIAVYTKREGFFEASPPLEDLAYMNLEHYQIRSDQRNALSVASFPILAATGWEDNGTNTLSFGPNKMLVASAPDAKFYFVESAGAHLAAGDKELKSLEGQMTMFGLQFEVASETAQSATGRALDFSEGIAPLLAWTLGLEVALNTMLDYMGQWIGMAAGSAGKVEVNKDFGMSMADQAELETLQRTRAAGDMSRESYLTELVRRGVLPEDFDVEAEMAKVDAEGPPLAAFAKKGNPTGLGSPKPIVDPSAGASGDIQ